MKVFLLSVFALAVLPLVCGAVATANQLEVDGEFTSVVDRNAESELEVNHETAGIFQRMRARQLEWIANTDAWLYTGRSGHYVRLQDTRMSPLVYSGLGTDPHASLEIVRERWMSPTSFAVRRVTLDENETLADSYSTFALEADTALLYRIPDTGFAVGGGVRGGAHRRVYDKLRNSRDNADVIFSANAVGLWEVPFVFLSRFVRIHLRLDVPAVSWVTRSPNYALFSSRSFWAPPNSFFRSTVETGVTWQLRWSNENTARIVYAWDFYAMNEHDNRYAVRSAAHSLVLSFGLRSM